MSSNTVFLEKNEPSEAADKKANIDVCWGAYIKVLLGVAILYLCSRLYLHTFAYSKGLDYFEPEFAVYWMRLFWAQIIVSSMILIGVCYYMWRTRELAPDSLSAEDELARYFRFITWLVAYTFVVLIAGPLAGESDAAWHQVVIRDTDFTPTHVGLFYGCFPALIITGVGSFLYAKTRLPQHIAKSHVALGIAIGGPILIMPNVGFNEWGHTFFYAEEVFNAPIHWGFAGLGLALLALGGVVVQIVSRMKELVDEIAQRS